MTEIPTATSPICDFCSSREVVWRYPCESFGITAIFMRTDGQTMEFPWASAGDWAACDTCALLIEQEKWQSLAERSFNTSTALKQMQNALLVKGEVVKAILKLHAQFRKRKGERVML